MNRSVQTHRLEHWLLPVSIATVFACLAPPALSAPEITTDAERTYLELRKSKDRTTQLLAERWNGLIQLQEWSDASGKFTTTAKYVEHDPDMKWVKLRVIQGTGDKRVVKDLQVSLEKLSKTCQSRVRQIAAMKEKVAAAVTAQQEKGAEKGAHGDMSNVGDAAGDPLSGLGGGEQGGMEGDRMPAEGARMRSTRGQRGRADSQRSVEPPTSDAAASRDPRQSMPADTGPPGSEPLPAALPPLPSDAGMLGAASSPPADATTRPVAVAPGAASSPQPDSHVARAAALGTEVKDAALWRTNYDAFRANFSARQDENEVWRVEWGALDALPRIRELEMRQIAAQQGGPRLDSNTPDPATQLAGLGEVTWEATLTAPVDGRTNWSEVFDLAPLPEPLKLGIRLDEERDTGEWQRLKVGDRVRFIGRFIGLEGEYEILIAIRFPAGGPPASAESSERR